MKKLLILSCSTGEGHNSAAKALAEAAERAGIYSHIADPVAFGGKKAESLVASCYNNMIKRSPALFGAVYQAGRAYSATGVTSPVYLANKLYSRALSDYIKGEGYTAVICTHLYGMESVTAAYRKGLLDVPAYGVLTDYTCIPFIAETELTGYFSPHPDLTAELTRKGIAENLIFPLGIPVSGRFNVPQSRSQAREELGVPQNGKMYLVMSGGVGCGNLSALCDELLACGGGEFSVYIIAGRNEKLRRELSESYESRKNVRILGFTDKVALYMRAADVLISKAGGLSSTEAAVAGVPFVQLMTIPGCETKNTEFFSKRGMSVKATSPGQAAAAAARLADSPDEARRMVEMQRKNIPQNAADKIIEQVMK